MGWLWQSPKPHSTEDGAAATPIPTEQAVPSDAEANNSSPRRGKTRDELAEAEFQAFLSELQDPHAAGSPSEQPRNQQIDVSSSASSGANAIQPYPTSMSCTTYFDAAWFCQLPGGQFVNVYRYGTFRKCSDLWSRFWFCMRTNRGFMSDEQRQRRVKAFYKERERRLLEGPNSEQVWEARKTIHPRPFGVDSTRETD